MEATRNELKGIAALSRDMQAVGASCNKKKNAYFDLARKQERELAELRAENAKMREALQSIKDQLYQKDQEEITRINDAYDVARAALEGSR